VIIFFFNSFSYTCAFCSEVFRSNFAPPGADGVRFFLKFSPPLVLEFAPEPNLTLRVDCTYVLPSSVTTKFFLNFTTHPQLGTSGLRDCLFVTNLRELQVLSPPPGFFVVFFLRLFV